MQTLIITNGNIKKKHYLKTLAQEHDYVICADGAVRHLRAVGVLPSYVVGDMDSIREEDLHWLHENHVPIKKYDTNKDYTDTELAIRHAFDDGARRITLTGALGGRIDHCMGNIYLLAFIHQLGCMGKIVEWDAEVMVVSSHITMEWNVADTVSLIPFTESVEGVCIKGFKYPLVNETLLLGHTRGLCNVVSEQIQSVTIERGKLLVIRNK